MRALAMGSIRQTYIKRVAIELVKTHPGAFTSEYAHNKQKVLELTDLRGPDHADGSPGGVKFKKLANRIAGYVTTYHKRMERAG